MRAFCINLIFSLPNNQIRQAGHQSNQDYSDICWVYLLNSPVVKIVVQITVSDHEFEFLEKFLILMNVKRVEHIISFLLCYH